jgi:hypothetical protein
LLTELSSDISVPVGRAVTDSAGVSLGVHQLSRVVSFPLQLAGWSLLQLCATGEVGEAALVESLVLRSAGVPVEVRVVEAVNISARDLSRAPLILASLAEAGLGTGVVLSDGTDPLTRTVELTVVPTLVQSLQSPRPGTAVPG